MAVRRSARPSVPAIPAPSPLLPDGAHAGSSPATHDRAVPAFPGHVRGRHLLVIDLLGIVVAAYVALALRFDRISGPFFVPAFPVVVGVLLGARTITNIRLGLYTRRWRFASVPDLERIVAAVALGSLVSMALFYVAAGIAGAAAVGRYDLG